MSDPKPLLFGIVGAGFMGATYAQVVAAGLRGARLAAIAGGSRGPALAQQHGVAFHADMMPMLRDPQIGAVIIATPHALHAEQAIAAAEHGKHVLIEKPMAASVADCDRILAACTAHGVRHAVAFGQRERICNKLARELLRSGKVGRLRHMRSFHAVGGGMQAVPRWQLERENVGILFGHGIHNFDAMRWYTGSEIHSIVARCGAMDPAFNVEATSEVLVTMQDGTVGSIFCSFELPAPGLPRMQYGAQLICERGLIDVDAYGELRASIDGGPWEVLATQAPVDWHGKGFLDPIRLESYTLQLQNFVDAIAAGEEPSVTGRDGRQAVAGVLAAYESSAARREVIMSEFAPD
jgi:phthalate 4,5-cis-dihydrodiol dehydrogenase